MIRATGGEPPREFIVPPDIRFEKVDPTTGSVADSWTAHPIQVALRIGQTASAVTNKSGIVEEDLSPEQ